MLPVSRPIDFRVQPPWRMTEHDPESIGTAGLGNYERLYGKDYKRGHSLAGLCDDLRRHGMRAVVQSEPVTGTVAAWNDGRQAPVNNSLEDDQLEIPAFLRRQAH